MYLILFYNLFVSKNILSEFIDLYKSFSCIEQVNSKEHQDINAKFQLYEIFAEKNAYAG